MIFTGLASWRWVPLSPSIGHPGKPVKIVVVIFAAVVHQEVLLFRHQGQDVLLADLEIGRQLDGQGGAGLLAQAAVNAAGEIDAKPGGPAAAVARSADSMEMQLTGQAAEHR